MPRQFSRQPSLTQNADGPWTQFPHVKLLGHAMLLIIIPAGATVTRSEAQRFKTTGPVTGAPILALIDVALHQHHRMAPMFLPIGIDPLKAQTQDPRCQVRVLLTFGQNQKTAIVDHKTKPAGPPSSGFRSRVLWCAARPR